MCIRDRIQGADDSFLYRLRCRLKDMIQGVVMKHLSFHDAAFTVVGNDIAGGKGDRDVSAAVSHEGSYSAQADGSPLCHAAQLTVAERQVRADHDDDGTLILVVFRFRKRRGDLLSVDAQVAKLSEVGHQNGSQGIFLILYFYHSRSRTDRRQRPCTKDVYKRQEIFCGNTAPAASFWERTSPFIRT